MRYLMAQNSDEVRNMGLATAASLPSLKADIVYPQAIVPCENVKIMLILLLFIA